MKRQKYLAGMQPDSTIFKPKDMLEQHRLLNTVATLIDAEKVKTTLTQRLEPIYAANLRLAHEKVLAEEIIGKLVLECF
ncbi:MAG: hypothetical protein ACM32O_17775 [Clostridia bacterium]